MGLDAERRDLRPAPPPAPGAPGADRDGGAGPREAERDGAANAPLPPQTTTRLPLKSNIRPSPSAFAGRLAKPARQGKSAWPGLDAGASAGMSCAHAPHLSPSSPCDPRVALVRLQGTITPRPGFGGGLSLAGIARRSTAPSR
jgi:hypothetical protein